MNADQIVDATHATARFINEKVINDIVHGLINLPAHIVHIIDTPQFQRLKSITQLGLVPHVYPSASYSRFEHSVGTFHLGSELIKQIQRQIKDEGLGVSVSDEEIKCIEIAALCHDLGHGPYSHMWEHAFDVKANISHEQLSVEILFDLIKNEKVKDSTKGLDFDLIGRMILGKFDTEKDFTKRFLFEIVANKVSGLDVDKFDYLCRDLIYLGWSNKNKIHDIKRIIHFIRVIKDDKGEWILAIRDREIFHIYDIFYSRHMLHRYGYQHKTVKSVECMFKNALAKIVTNEDYLKEFIDNVVGIKDEKKEYDKMFLHSKEFISKCCDFHVWSIMSKYTGVVKDIHERKLYKLYCKLQINQKDENIQFKRDPINVGVEKLENFINGKLRGPADMRKYVNIVWSRFSLASEAKGDPISLIPFYKKGKPNECFKFVKGHEPPALVRFISDDNVLMVFTDDTVSSGTPIGAELQNFKEILLGGPNIEILPEEIEQLLTAYNFQELQY